VNTCNKCNNLPQSGYIYVIDSSLWANKIKDKKRVNSETRLSRKRNNNIWLENEDISTKSLRKAHTTMLTKTYYACGNHEEEVKTEMLENLPNLIDATDGLNSENILSFPIVNNIPKTKRKFWK
jgi:hypothetical protein